MEWKTIEFSWVLMKKLWNKGFGEDGRSFKQKNLENLRLDCFYST